MKKLVSSLRKPDPLPAQIVVVAFPGAYKQIYAPDPSTSGQDFFLVQAPSSEIDIEKKNIEWLTLFAADPIAPFLSKVRYEAEDNTRLVRSLNVPINVYQKRYTVEFNQQAGLLVQEEMVRVLNTPLTIDFLVAVTYIAGVIKKLQPPPIKIIAAIIAILVIIALGFIISTVRHAFVNVPEPKPLSTNTNGVPITIFPGLSVEKVLPLPSVCAEDQTIALQTIKQLYWLIKQIL